ncbi:unnamed protein product [Miscanthus lutarioriparius]|uniref:Uncharacterized protein n=1 Tax=Miscanthus lutarioriparius TaxID=422564 RepID=A0A811QZ06_9POAL|nr:unnamed protein product [Miscanthus lutarioriparius]
MELAPPLNGARAVAAFVGIGLAPGWSSRRKAATGMGWGSSGWKWRSSRGGGTSAALNPPRRSHDARWRSIVPYAAKWFAYATTARRCARCRPATAPRIRVFSTAREKESGHRVAGRGAPCSDLT